MSESSVGERKQGTMSKAQGEARKAAAERVYAEALEALRGPADIYVLHRGAYTARDPHLVAWQAQHRLSSGFNPEHAGRHDYVLVLGHPDGLDLPARCTVAHLDDFDLARLFRGNTDPLALFGEVVP